MATDIAEEEADAAVSDELAAPEEETQTGFNLSSKKLKLILLLLLVMGVQVAVGYMLLPAPAATNPDDPDDLNSLKGEIVEDDINKLEVTLGTFNTTVILSGGSGTVIHFKCKLTAIVASENSQSIKDAATESHKDRIRAAVNRVIRSSSLEELNDPDANVMKRKIRAEVNKVMPKAFIIEVIISDIRVIPQ